MTRLQREQKRTNTQASKQFSKQAKCNETENPIQTTVLQANVSQTLIDLLEVVGVCTAMGCHEDSVGIHGAGRVLCW